MYDYDENALAEVMIAKHCEWLNLWTANEAKANPDDWEKPWAYFSDQFNETTNILGFRKVLGAIYHEPDAESLILTVMIYDGDEGGPQTLTGFFDANTIAYYKYKLGHVTSEPNWGHTEPSSWSYDHTELDGWVLDSMVQEFDTDRRMVWEDGAFSNTPESQGYGTDDEEEGTDG